MKQSTNSYGMSTALQSKLTSRGITKYTNAQIAALEAGLCKGENLLVCAPTSSGKTTIAEIAAIEGALRGHRTVYLVSHRALAEEKYKLFSREYQESGWFDVSIATGDHTEGVWESGVLIVTYEKYLALVCAENNYSMQGKVIVADELQILGEESRGPDIELLCTLIRRGQPEQFVGLSATISNPKEISDWLGCTPIELKERDVPLRQEIWFKGNVQYANAGHPEIFDADYSQPMPTDTLDAIDQLLILGRAPILVFTMTKPRALELAEGFSKRRQRAAKGLRYVEQLELFSEPSTLVRTLAETSQRGVAFHTADLSFSERMVVEEGLSARMFDVIFATPTLAAGVNFPFQTVLFDSFHRRFIKQTPWLPQSEFQNMSGRAGRLGLHEKGYAILLARTEVDYHKAIELLTSDIAPLQSVFLSCSLRKVVLAMISSRIVRKYDELLGLFKDTFWWHQVMDANPIKLETLPSLLEEAVKYLAQAALISLDGNSIYATRLGVGVAASGLLPQTAIFLLEIVREHIEDFSLPPTKWAVPMIHAIFASEDFAPAGQRILPYARWNQPEPNAWSWINNHPLFLNPNSIERTDAISNATYGLGLWIDGTPERTLRNLVPPISYGQMQRLGSDVAWVLEGFSELCRIPDAAIPSSICNALSGLGKRVRYGVPADILDILRAGISYNVPGFGRHRGMALFKKEIATPNDVLKADRDLLHKILESETRVEKLLEALQRYFEVPLETWKPRHAQKAQAVHIDPVLIRQAYEFIGEQYEAPILALLELVTEWSVSKIDNGKRQGYPDFLIQFEEKAILLECKTKEKGECHHLKR